MADKGGFRIMGKITSKLFPKGTETPQTIGRDFVKKSKRGPEPQDKAWPVRGGTKDRKKK
jgi:hypothetical protein